MKKQSSKLKHDCPSLPKYQNLISEIIGSKVSHSLIYNLIILTKCIRNSYTIYFKNSKLIYP